MSKKRNIAGLLVVVLVIAVGVFALVTLPTNSQNNTPKSKQSQKQITNDEVPVVDFNAPETADAKERAKRLKRGSKYDSDNPIKETDSNQPDLMELPLSHAPEEPAFPAPQSDLVLIGTITNSQAFLSANKSSVYSEFSLRIENILKSAAGRNLASGDTITVERVGGGVRFSSGLIQKRGVFGLGLPQNKGRYALFLKKNSNDDDFSIITGYRLENGKVLPLDGATDFNAPVYKNYALYKNIDESEFLKQLNEALNTSTEVLK